MCDGSFIVAEVDLKASCFSRISDIKIYEQVVGVIRALHALDGNPGVFN